MNIIPDKDKVDMVGCTAAVAGIFTVLLAVVGSVIVALIPPVCLLAITYALLKLAEVI